VVATVTLKVTSSFACATGGKIFPILMLNPTTPKSVSPIVLVVGLPLFTVNPSFSHSMFAVTSFIGRR
jgi:hypothetical protein